MNAVDRLGPTRELVTITIDGRDVQAPAGAYLLEVARAAGIEIPTLCHHVAVEPAGACRLCMVEVTHPDWGGWSGLMTACLYPASRGLVVSTASETARAARRQVLTLLAARCPGSAVIRALAERHGAAAPPELRVDHNADHCIMCGLCTRVCEAWATTAITTCGRGATKAVGAFGGAPPAECVGCGACALVCPTGHIAARRTAEAYEIWGRSFATAVCSVDESRCVGCGACEEACPFAVARVALDVSGARLARIPAASCRGCGACVGACPGGAIAQAGVVRDAAPGRLVVYACPRAGLAGARLEGIRSFRSVVLDARTRIQLRELPCVGGASVPLLLAELAAGSDGVLVLGRHQESCRLRGAEDPARDRVERAAELAELAGLGPGRVRFVEPDPGRAGPSRAVALFDADLAPSPLRAGDELGLSAAPSSVRGPELRPRGEQRALREEGVDAALAQLRAIAAAGVRPDGAGYLARRGLPAASPGAPALCAGLLPYLELVGGSLFDPLDVPATLRAGLAVLARLGVAGAGVAIVGPAPLCAADATSLRAASAVYALDAVEVDRLGAAGIDARLLAELLERSPAPAAAAVACDVDREGALVRALGQRAIGVGPDPLADRAGVDLGPDDRRRAEEHLARAERAGAAALLVASPLSLARWAIVTRHGSWRSSRIGALLPHELAHRLWTGAGLAQPAAWRPARPVEVRP
jgi:formate hydrogenlyase subunit 6/NADH:ubiquinone oxidoreductase subunit I/coenzyme F420-reducing hydrogenase delta subunit